MLCSAERGALGLSSGFLLTRLLLMYQTHFSPLKEDNFECCSPVLNYSVHSKYCLKWNPDNTNVPLAIRSRVQSVIF